MFPSIQMESQHSILQACPICGVSLDVSACEPLQEVICPQCRTGMCVERSYHQFTLVEILGDGGMGTVYRARDTQLNRQVALKLLAPELCSDRRTLMKLEKEAKTTASINHPNVLQVYSFGQDAGRFYLVMELIENGSLDDLIQAQGGVSEIQVLQIGIQIAEGLLAAHELGLVHRDIKPGNILFSKAGAAKVADFGLAGLADHLTAGNEIWGTPLYIAPEKLCQMPEDHRSDIYSLGATLFHALAGRPPYDAENCSAVALKHLKARAVSVQAFAPHVSDGTAFVINRMMNKDPEKRYQIYEELLEHLKYALSSIETGRGPAKVRAVVETEQQQTFWGWATAIMLLIGITAAVCLFTFRDKIFIRSTASVNASSTPAEYSPPAVKPEMKPSNHVAPPVVAKDGFSNASFETPAVTTHTMDGAGTDWSFSNNAGVQRNGSAYSGSLVVAPDGVQTAFLQGKKGTNGSMSQTVHLAAGSYAVHFYLSGVWNRQQPIAVSIDGVEIGKYTPSGDKFEQVATGAFKVEDGNHTITFSTTDNSSDKTAFIDRLSIEKR